MESIPAIRQVQTDNPVRFLCGNVNSPGAYDAVENTSNCPSAA